MTEPKKTIVIVGEARSGTSYFYGALDRYKGVCSHSDLFDPVDIHVNQKHKKLINETTFELRKEDPLAFFDKILLISKGRFISHKMLLSHMNESVMGRELYEAVVKRSNLVLFLTRNGIDRYISNLKAQKIQSWAHIDTTNIKIEFDIYNYEDIRENNEINTYYIKDFCQIHSLKIVEIKYDEFFKLNEDEREIFLTNILEEAFSEKFQINKTIVNYFTKQDLSTSYADKIENYEEVKDYIEKELEKIKSNS